VTGICRARCICRTPRSRSARRRSCLTRTAEIVVYCASATCQNSHIAARVLGQLGYANVRVYAGGKEDWSEAGLALEREAVSA
jgi:rhodanese-related sulfurtransferase